MYRNEPWLQPFQMPFFRVEDHIKPNFRYDFYKILMAVQLSKMIIQSPSFQLLQQTWITNHLVACQGARALVTSRAPNTRRIILLSGVRIQCKIFTGRRHLLLTGYLWIRRKHTRDLLVSKATKSVQPLLVCLQCFLDIFLIHF